jgi:hypothetical protein
MRSYNRLVFKRLAKRKGFEPSVPRKEDNGFEF